MLKKMSLLIFTVVHRQTALHDCIYWFYSREGWSYQGDSLYTMIMMIWWLKSKFKPFCWEFSISSRTYSLLMCYQTLDILSLYSPSPPAVCSHCVELPGITAEHADTRSLHSEAESSNVKLTTISTVISIIAPPPSPNRDTPSAT